jgi:hypothetical protein
MARARITPSVLCLAAAMLGAMAAAKSRAEEAASADAKQTHAAAGALDTRLALLLRQTKGPHAAGVPKFKILPDAAKAQPRQELHPRSEDNRPRNAIAVPIPDQGSPLQRDTKTEVIHLSPARQTGAAPIGNGAVGIANAAHGNAGAGAATIVARGGAISGTGLVRHFYAPATIGGKANATAGLSGSMFHRKY